MVRILKFAWEFVTQHASVLFVIFLAMLALSIPLSDTFTIRESGNALSVIFSGSLLVLSGMLLLRGNIQKVQGTFVFVPLSMLLLAAVIGTSQGGFETREVVGSAFEQGTLIAMVTYAAMIFAGYVFARVVGTFRGIAIGIVAVAALAAGAYCIALVFGVSVMPLSLSTFIFFGFAFILTVYLSIRMQGSVFDKLIVLGAEFLLAAAMLFSGSKILLMMVAAFAFIVLCIPFIATRFRSTNNKMPALVGLLVIVGIAASSIWGLKLLQSTTTLAPEVSPSYAATAHVGLALIGDMPRAAITGMGGNSFKIAWDRYMPTQVAETGFWDYDFAHGPSFFITFAIEYGIPLTLAVLILGVLSIPVLVTWRGTEEYVFGLGASFLFGFCTLLVYAPNTAFITLVSLTGGVLLGAMSQKRTSGDTRDMRILNIPFVHGFAVGAVLIAGMWLVVSPVPRFLALHYYGKGSDLIQENNVIPQKAVEYLERSVAFSEISEPLRFLARVQIQRSSSLLESNQNGISPEDYKEVLNLSANAISLADAARSVDDLNYRNHVVFGDAQSFRGTVLKNREIVERANESYKNAVARSPQRAQLHLLLARSHFVLGRFEDALEHAAQAVALRPNYPEAQQFLKEVVALKKNIPRAQQAPVQESGAMQ